MTHPDRHQDPIEDRGSESTCAEFVELTTDYLDDALRALDVVRFETHLSQCEGCTAVLDQLRRNIAATGELRQDEIDPRSLDRLRRMFANWRSAKN